ncbi:MAG: sulfatase [Thermoanaerobaculia bacterium]|nr:sulfatase [Thermoanaerobaculia bacterium]
MRGLERGLVLALAALVAGCGPQGNDDRSAPLPATRGVILISIDALGAKHLGAYGGPEGVSPFLDALAERALVFERAAVQYPSTLTSHLSILTGLYPAEHGVYPPSSVLAETIPTLPELFQAAGYRTAGHTEGGFMAGGFGFARGFDVFTDTPHQDETDVERTFSRGIDFLGSLAPREKFFLFLHTYAVHDPYDPPAEFRGAVEPAVGPPPTGPEIRRLNDSGEPLDPALVERYRRLYRGSVRYVDSLLEKLFGELERLRLLHETTVVVTSDHGEEFGEHGRLGHAQLYPEHLFVPLVVVHPAVAGAVRVSTLVESLDLAPTLLDLQGIDLPEGGMSGRSLLPLLREPRTPRPARAYAEMVEERRHRTLLDDGPEGLWQLLVSEPHADPEGVWLGGAPAVFDVWSTPLTLRARSFDRERRVAIAGPSGALGERGLGPEWQEWRLDLSGQELPVRLTLSADGCASPEELGLSDDARCLAVQLARPPLWLTELYHLAGDPEARTPVRDPERLSSLARRLSGLEFVPRAHGVASELSEETVRTLRALGYLE